MRVARDLRLLLRIRKRRGYYRKPVPPRRRLPSPLTRYYTVGGVINAPRGSRSWALRLVRREIEEGTYLSDWRLNAALDRLLASLF
jgi:hypothetical protein